MAFTLEVYSHVLPHMQDTAAKKVEAPLMAARSVPESSKELGSKRYVAQRTGTGGLFDLGPLKSATVKSPVPSITSNTGF